MIVAVGSAIIRKDDKFLFVKEAKPSAIGRWGLPGGKLEEGESIIECVRREVREETGYEVSSEKLLRVINKPKTHEGNTVLKFVFTCEITTDRVSPAEHEYKYLDIEAVSDLQKQNLIRGDEIPDLLKLSFEPQSERDDMLWIM